jgi:uncharacterized protein (TIGR03435 family)
MVERAYGLKDYQVESRGPAWIGTDLYQVAARSPAPANHAQMMAMLQTALVQRFGLHLRTEHRDVPAYLLKIAPHGSKLQTAVKTSHCGEVMLRAEEFSADCVSADDIAGVLQDIVHGRPVRNDTGLPSTGRYRIDLQFAANARWSGPQRVNAARPASGDAGPSLFSALPDQLGLRLEAGKMATSVLIILSAHRPSGN